MDKKSKEVKDTQEETEVSADEKVSIRHTITAEETFTLAKDVYDIRCFVKNVYNNRAVIARRLNNLSLALSLIFTVLYTAYMIYAGLFTKLTVATEVVMYVLLGVYTALVVVLVVISLVEGRTNTKAVSKINKVLKIFRIFVRIASICISVAALSLSVTGGKYAAPKVAVDVVIITLSIIMLIVQLIPLIFGGFGRLARWLLSPVRIKYRFSYVVLEWYRLALSGKSAKGSSVKKVSKRYFDKIGTAIDKIIIPSLGQKYITAVKPVNLLNTVESTPLDDRPVVEGILKSVFEYAAECGYVAFDPCKDLNFEGTIEEKPKKTMKDRFYGVGKKIGKTVLDKYINGTSGEGK